MDVPHPRPAGPACTGMGPICQRAVYATACHAGMKRRRGGEGWNYKWQHKLFWADTPLNHSIRQPAFQGQPKVMAKGAARADGW